MLKAQQEGVIPRGAPRIKQVYAYQKFFKMLRDGIPAETVRTIFLLWFLVSVLISQPKKVTSLPFFALSDVMVLLVRKVKEKMVGEGLNPVVLDLPGEAVDPTWPVFVQPEPRGPPIPVLNLSEDIDDPRLPWILRKYVVLVNCVDDAYACDTAAGALRGF